MDGRVRGRTSISVVGGRLSCTGVADITIEECPIQRETELDRLVIYKHLSGARSVLMDGSR
jgi:hypothetical protein